MRGGTGGTLGSKECRLAGSGGSPGSAEAVDGGVKQAGARQLLRGGIGGAAGGPSSSAGVGGGSGGVTGAGGERKMCRFMGTGRGAGRGAGAGGAWARSRPARIRRRWPGRCMPMSNRMVSLRPWHSVAHTSPCCSKRAVYCSRCSARSHSATDRAASLLSAMASGSRGPGPGSDRPPRSPGPLERLFLFPKAPHGVPRWTPSPLLEPPEPLENGLPL